jgi:hypothetical protein
MLALGTQQISPALSADMSLLPKPETRNNITYLSGGVGEDEAAAMKAAAKSYNLMLTFVVQGTGQYRSDVGIKIQDMTGKTLLDTVSNGPMFLATLPAGSYKITTSENGMTRTRTVHITPRQHVREVVAWPESVTG